MSTDAARRVVVTDHRFGALTRLEEVVQQHGASLAVYQVVGSGEVARVTSGADVVLNDFAPVTAEVLEGLADGAVVVRYGIGYDNVDMVAAKKLGVRVANVPDYGVDTVADHAVALILSATRRITVYDRRLRGSGWLSPMSIGPLKALSDSVLGLVGTGRIGLAVAVRMAAFGSRILAFDPYADAEAVGRLGVTLVGSVEELLAQADIVSLHAPLTPSTRGLIDGDRLRLMKPDAILVNTARGPLVDTEALAEALTSGTIAGAALDVVDPEPLPDTSRLWATEAILTPHAGFYSARAVMLLERLAAEEAGRALAGEPLRSEVVVGDL